MLEVTLGVGIVAVLVLLLQPLTAKFFKRKWRYWVWLVLAIRLLVPINLSLPSVVEVELPRNEIVMTQTTPQTSVTPPEMQEVPVIPDTQDTPTYEPIDRPVYVRPVTTVKGENEKTVPITVVLGTVWIVVAVAMFLYQIVTHLLFFKRTNRFNHTVTDAETLDVLNRICKEMGITQKVDIFYNGRIQSPLLVGFFKPRILLPKFPNKPQDVEMILRHELMHFKRHDIWYKLLVRAAWSLHWFNPIIWIMARVADEDLERACDEDVVKNQNENFRHGYCESILHVVRMQKSKEPALAAGFASRPSDLRNRFVRILDMTRRRAGKTALIIVACITVTCTVFIGCELGGVIDVSSNIGPSDTSSQPDETSPYDVEAIVEKTLNTSIPEDEELMSSLRNYVGSKYVASKVLLKDSRAIKSEVTNVRDHDSKTQTVRTALFLVDKKDGKELVLMQVEVIYYAKDGLLTAKTVNMVSFSGVSMGEKLSTEDLNGAELVFIENTRTCGVYLPSRNSMLSPLVFDLVEVKNVDKNAPTLIDYDIRGELNTHKKAEEDSFVAVRKPDGKTYLEYYDAQIRSLIRLSDYEMSTEYSCFYNMGEGRVAIAFIDALAVYDFNTNDPFTPISVITKEDMGVSHFDPLWYPVSDRNNDKRLLMTFKDENENLGFVTFDYDGNLTNSFVTDLKIVRSGYTYVPTFVGNIAYFTNVSEEYLGLNYSKYAVDVRKGKDNTPQLQNETFVDEMNITLDEFRYDVSSKAYPFILGDQEGIAMEHGFGLSAVVDNIQTTWNFKQVSYNAETENVVAYAYTFKGKTMPYIKGRLSIENDGVYLTPYNLDVIPIPAKTNTGFIKIRIDTTDLEALKEYASTFEKDNVVIGVEGMKITRQNGELSYLAEICEMFNGDYDYITRQNKALDILKTYGAISDGCFELRPGETIVNASIEYEPEIYASPLTPITHRTFKTVPALLDWYATYTSREQIDGVPVAQLQNTMYEQFTKQWTFDAEEFEKAVLEHFDVTLEFLRESEYYKAKTSTYEYSSQSLWGLEEVGISQYFQSGNYLQIFFWSYTTNENYCLTVLLDGDSYRFVDIQARANAIYEAPALFVTNLIPES